MIHPLRITTASLAAVLLFSAKTHAAGTVWNGAGDGISWDDGANWTAGEVPGTTDTAASPRVNGGGSTTLDSAVPGVKQVYIGLSGSGTATMNVTTGANLTSDNGFFVGWAASVSNAVYNQDGGSITITGNNEFSIARGAADTTATTAQGTISNGTLTTQVMRVAARFSNGSNGTLNITGGTVSATSLLVGNGTSVGSLSIGGTANYSTSGNADFGTDATLTNNASLAIQGSAATIDIGANMFLRGRTETSFAMDASGIAAIAIANELFIGGNNSALDIDGSGYAGLGTFDLFTFDSLAGASATNFTHENLTGFGARTASVVYNADSIQLSITPEPTAAMLLGLAGLALLRRRRWSP